MPSLLPYLVEDVAESARAAAQVIREFGRSWPNVGLFGHVRGHHTRWDQKTGRFVFTDTGDPVDMAVPFGGGRPCAACGEHPTEAGHDACIADLPEVKFACCGHGGSATPYVTFLDGSYITKEAALAYFVAEGRNVTDVPPAR